MHTAARTVSMLISACSLTRRMIAPIASSVKSTLVTERYLLASYSTCVMAMTMLASRPAAAKTIPALTTFLCAPEASMATMRVAARAAVVASHAYGSLGADIEKNTVIMSNTRTRPNWSRIRDRSRSYLPGHPVLVSIARYAPGEPILYTACTQVPASDHHEGVSVDAPARFR